MGGAGSVTVVDVVVDVVVAVAMDTLVGLSLVALGRDNVVLVLALAQEEEEDAMTKCRLEGASAVQEEEELMVVTIKYCSQPDRLDL